MADSPNPSPEPRLEPLEAVDPPSVGPFRVRGRLGAGGMGVVYGATDPSGAWVAVKVVRAEYTSDPEFRARFDREITLMRRVRARCIAPVLASDTSAAQPWYATPYIAGPTLTQHVAAHGPLPTPKARVVAAGIAEAVAAIHAAGVVHRDLKPGNIILAPDGPKVLDFGIARAVDESAITRTGGVVGSPGWMSPERFRGHTGPEADVFAWGALVAYAATGRPPFGTGGAETLMYRVLNEDPDLTGLPAELSEVITRALDKNPTQRPAARDLVRQVGAPNTPTPVDDATIIATLIHRDWTPLPAPPPSSPRPPAPPTPPPVDPRGHAPRRPRRRGENLEFGAAVAALVLLGGAGAWVVLRTTGDPTSGAGGDASPLQLGYILPETGDLGFLGAGMISAVELAHEDVNEAGGVLGTELPEIVTTDEGIPNSIDQAGSTLLTQEVDAVLGPASSENTPQVIDQFSGADVVQCSGSAVSSDLDEHDDDGYFFRTGASDLLLGEALAQMAVRDGHDTVAILNRDDAYGSELAEVIHTTLSEEDVDVVRRTVFDPTAVTFDDVVDEIDSAAADAVLLVTFEEGTQLVSDLLDAGLDGDQLYGTDAMAVPELGELVDSEDSSVVSGFQGVITEGAPAEFENRLTEHTPGLESFQYTAQYYDCVTVIALAAEAAGSTDPSDFVTEMAAVTQDGEACSSFTACRSLLNEGYDIDYEGISGPIAFDENGDVTRAAYPMYRFNDNGEFVEPEPVDIATGN